jgi:hypothetical protein
MTIGTRPTRRTLRHLALGAGAALCAIGGGRAAAGGDRPPAEELLRIASDEPLIVRFATPVRASRVGSESFRIARESDGERASGRYVAGSFLVDPDTGIAVVVDPEACIESVMVARSLDRGAATNFVERALARYGQSGRARDFAPLRSAIGSLETLIPGTTPFDPVLGSAGGGYWSLPQQDASAPAAARALRAVQAGDDALWEAYITGNDVSAFAALSSDPRAARFHHSINPMTGQPRAESDYQRFERRRFLFTGARTGRVFTFVPDVPETPELADVAFTANDGYTVTLAAGLPTPIGGISTSSGFRAAVRHRVAHLETTNPLHSPAYGQPVLFPEFGLSEMNNAPIRIVDVTPPNGERLVDPSTDWENPDNRFTVPAPQRRPFVARVRFNQPLDPRTVSPTSFNMTQTRASIGTANERTVQMPVPVDVRLRQSRLGDVEVEIQPRIPLDPAAAYEIRVRNLVDTLDGRSKFDDLRSEFETASIPDQIDVLFDDFQFPGDFWLEADAAVRRPLVAADAAHDPAGLGLFVPFLGGDPAPVAAIERSWLDTRTMAPRFVVRFDDPATQPIEGTNLHAPPGSSVRLFARTAPADVLTNRENLLMVGPWIELDPAHPEFPGSRFLQLRIEFTLPPGATPATPDLPYVERISVVALRP